MNTVDLVERVAKSTEVTKTQAKKIVKQILHEISQEIRSGNKVTLTGFGTFTRFDRKPRLGVNPSNGEKLKIPSAKIPKFKPGRTFRKLVNRGR